MVLKELVKSKEPSEICRMFAASLQTGQFVIDVVQRLNVKYQ